MRGSWVSGPASFGFHDSMTVPAPKVTMPIRRGGRAAALLASARGIRDSRNGSARVAPAPRRTCLRVMVMPSVLSKKRLSFGIAAAFVSAAPPERETLGHPDRQRREPILVFLEEGLCLPDRRVVVVAEVPPQRVRKHLVDQVPDERVLLLPEHPFELRRPPELLAGRERARAIDGRVADRLPPRADRVVLFQS